MAVKGFFSKLNFCQEHVHSAVNEQTGKFFISHFLTKSFNKIKLHFLKNECLLITRSHNRLERSRPF